MSKKILRGETFFQEELEYRFKEREQFILEEYPGDAEYIVRTALEGFDVIEHRSSNFAKDIQGICTYRNAIDQDKKGYTQVGVFLVSEENRGEGILEEMFYKVREKCDPISEYYTALADTPAGARALDRLGFYEEEDSTGKTYYRLDN